MDTVNKSDITPVICQPPERRKRKPLKYLLQEKQIYNVNFLFTADLSEVLMIHKNRGPYPNTINGVGGKYDSTLDHIYGGFEQLNVKHSASREIQEEASSIIRDEDLYFVLCEIFPDGDITPWNPDHFTELWVFCGIVNKDEVSQKEDEKLEWFKTEDIISSSVRNESIAGNGNVPYFVNLAVRLLQDKLSVAEVKKEEQNRKFIDGIRNALKEATNGCNYEYIKNSDWEGYRKSVDAMLFKGWTTKTTTESINKTGFPDEVVLQLIELNFGCTPNSIYDFANISAEWKVDGNNVGYVFNLVFAKTMKTITIDIDLNEGGSDKCE